MDGDRPPIMGPPITRMANVWAALVGLASQIFLLAPLRIIFIHLASFSATTSH